MQKMIGLVALGLALSLGAAQAAGPKEKASPAAAGQQSRMKDCNAEARSKALKGDERKAFMSECLKKK
ncbi:PsiF family protein [Ramlibacter sp.]|uniref:PsiF family protein n=1 Tax=Ramlibacter sp. TaxID=1917967 RepID=UPI002D4530AD|nr:PsiF family protein [Ramlibacter sp.]HYD76697.1 PsiF family protein [Ramlibacter sp.]